MTVLVKSAELSAPPLKRIKLCYGDPDPSLTFYQSMANPIDAGVMLNGYGGLVDTHKAHSPDDSSPNTEGVSPIATLCNLGNTCFLNSVLYTLRFAPHFLHNLHHLAVDLPELGGKYSHLKTKSSSLGRGIGGGSKAWSNKELSSMGQGSTNEDKIILATLRLHELYEALHHAELKDHIEPYQPEVFLTALRDVNVIFEGNQQHDAHELLVCVLDTVRETCALLSQLNERQRSIIPQPAPPSCPLPPPKTFSSIRKSLKVGKTKTNGVKNNISTGDAPLITDGTLSHEDDTPQVQHNFITEDFAGTMHLYTTCLECEKTNDKTEPFSDICVPITPPSGNCSSPEEISTLYHSAIITEEYLQDQNKYWCEDCGRYNEARRNVSFDSLPRLLTLHLKRFSSSFGACVQKVNEYMPTPLVLSCFCMKCKDKDESRKPHRGYQLYGIIMHLGSTMASGHYITYVCGRDTVTDSANCTKDKRKTASLSGGAGKPTANPQTEHRGIMRFFKSSKPTYPSALDNKSALFPPCRSADCCGCKLESSEPVWLECDDDTVKTMTNKQLEDLLGPKNSKNAALTPYILFYSRIQ